MLLLRDFFPFSFICEVKLESAAESMVAFSLSPRGSAEGRCAIDLRVWRSRGAFGLANVDIAALARSKKSVIISTGKVRSTRYATEYRDLEVVDHNSWKSKQREWLV